MLRRVLLFNVQKKGVNMSFIIAHIVQYLLAGFGLWQMITGTMLYGIMILLFVVASDFMIQKTIKIAPSEN